jgi:hypothetical protein
MIEVQSDHLVKIPKLTQDQGSLTAMEKSILAHFILLVRPQIIVELGVFRALTTQFMCQLLIDNEIDGRVVGFDLPDMVEDLRLNNGSINKYEELQRLQLVPGRLPISLKNWLGSTAEPIDFALVDATHDYHSVMGELSQLWPRLSASGVILCHDYSSKYDGVRYAVERFAAMNQAACMPLSPSDAAMQAGYWSCLVALRRNPHRPTIRGLFPHWLMSKKIALLANPGFNRLWHRLRPLFRRHQ